MNIDLEYKFFMTPAVNATIILMLRLRWTLVLYQFYSAFSSMV